MSYRQFKISPRLQSALLHFYTLELLKLRKTLRKGKKCSGSELSSVHQERRKRASTHRQLRGLSAAVTQVNTEPGDQASAKSREKVFLPLFKRLCPSGRAGTVFYRWQGQNSTRTSVQTALGPRPRCVAAVTWLLACRRLAFCWFRACPFC